MKKNKMTNIMAGVLIIVFTVMFLGVTGRFLYIQASGTVDGVSLKDWADKQRTASHSLPAERGKIFDNNGMTLAYDKPTFRIFAIVDKKYSKNSKEPMHVTDPDKTAEQLAPLLHADKNKLADIMKKGIENKSTQVEFGKLGKGISQKTKEKISKLHLPGIDFIKESTRYYPNGMFASQIIGFAKTEEKRTKDGFYVRNINGITGMEKQMDKLLHGKKGHISFERDNYNSKLLNPKEVITKPQDGDDVYLTIDQKIQTLLEDVLTQVDQKYEPSRMTAVVMNPKTGEILAMSNRPSYDPNNPENVKNWYNDAISTPFEPGSTMKIFTWASAINEGVYKGSEGYKSGKYRINERIQPIVDHNGGEGWGTISYDEGFRRSSNVAAAKLAWEQLGPEKYLDYLKAFDFDKKTGIDLPGEVQGKILYNWPLEKASTAFGQGSTLTPIQQMKAATAIANNGEMVQPYIIKKIIDPSSKKVIKEKHPKAVGNPISAQTSKHMLDLMESVVSGKHGTGKEFSLKDYSVAGKTGTAQIPNADGGGYMRGYDNYVFSFLGMAPKDDPELMMYVSVKQPKLKRDDGSYELGSTPVSFIFKNVMENGLHYLDIEPDEKKERHTSTITLPDLEGKSVSEAEKILKDKGLKPVVLGKTGKITKTSIPAGTKLIKNEQVVLLTDKPLMPDVTGWSLREVMQLSNMLELKLTTSGNGYVTSQSIKPGKPVKKHAAWNVKLQTPGN